MVKRRFSGKKRNISYVRKKYRKKYRKKSRKKSSHSRKKTLRHIRKKSRKKKRVIGGAAAQHATDFLCEHDILALKSVSYDGRNLPTGYIEYIQGFVNYLHEEYPFGSVGGSMLGAIRSGGSFTSKMDRDGRIIIDDDMRSKIELFQAITVVLPYPEGAGFAVKVYRTLRDQEVSVDLTLRDQEVSDDGTPQGVPGDKPHPIPFSCSWMRHFAVYAWEGCLQGLKIVDGKYRRNIVMEILFRGDLNIIPTSVPSREPQISHIPFRNQGQMEVVLPPGNLVYVAHYSIDNNYKGGASQVDILPPEYEEWEYSEKRRMLESCKDIDTIRIDQYMWTPLQG